MLQDRVAIVTGAGQGIGRAVAVELARAGAHVVASGRRPAPLEAVAGEVRALGRRSLALSCDVQEAAQVDQVVAETVREFGRVDLLVNNAGYRIRAPLDQLPRAEWDAMLGTNLTGVFLCCQAAGRVMIPQRAGNGPRGAAPAPGPPGGSDLGGDLPRLRSGELHHRGDPVRERRPPCQQPGGLNGAPAARFLTVDPWRGRMTR